MAKSDNNGGHDRSTKRSRASLAARARELTKEGDLLLEFYLTIMEGKNPVIIRDADGMPCGVEAEKYEEYGPGGPKGRAPTLDQKMLAVARVFERSHGMPTNHTTIEGEMRAEITSIVGGVDVKYVKKLKPAALLALKNAITSLAAPTPEEPAEEVIEGEFEEVLK